VRRLGCLREVRPFPLRDWVDRRAHADLVERATASGVSDRRGSDLRRAAGPGRGAVAGGADLRVGDALRTGARRGRGAAQPAAPTYRGEPVARDPVRTDGRAGRLRAG